MIESRSTSKFVLMDDKKYQREYALGMHHIKGVYDCDGVRRFFEDGEEVEFTDLDELRNYNAEFEINDNGMHRIWFSQLNGVYLNPNDATTVTTPVISFKNGTQQTVRNLCPSMFWDMVKGKRFRVSVGYDYPVALNQWNEKVKEMRNIGEIKSYIFENLAQENYDAVKGMTKPTRFYSLVEI